MKEEELSQSSQNSDFMWTKEKDLMVCVKTLKRLPTWNSDENNEVMIKLIREFLKKSSGGNVIVMLKDVLRPYELKELAVSEENVKKEEVSSQDHRMTSSSDNSPPSPSLLEDYNKENESNSSQETLIDVKEHINEGDVDIENTTAKESKKSRMKHILQEATDIEIQSISSLSTSERPINQYLKQRKSNRSSLSIKRKSSCLEDPDYEPESQSTVSTEDSFEGGLPKRFHVEAEVHPPPLRSSTPIISRPVIEISDNDDEGEESDNIPDFENDEPEAEEEGNVVKVLSPDSINRKLDKDHEEEGEERKGDDEEAEVVVTPDVDLVASTKKCTTTNEKLRTPRKGKGCLIESLREITDKDANYSDDEILSLFSFSKTKFIASGFSECLCQLPVDAPSNVSFEIRNKANVACNICHRCFINFMKSNEFDESTKKFLEMVFQFHYQGIESTYVRTEGQNKRIFELHGQKRWLKDLRKTSMVDVKKNPFLSKSFNVRTNGKVEMELMPASSSAGNKLQKSIKNIGEKFKLFMKIEATQQGDVKYKIRDIEAIPSSSGDANNELQTSIHDFFPTSKKI